MIRENFQAFAHGRTPDISYWNAVGGPHPTQAEAERDVVEAADRFWPLPCPSREVAVRRALFLSRCHILGPDGRLPSPWGSVPRPTFQTFNLD